MLAKVSARTVLGGVDGDDVVTDSLVQHPDEGCDGVLDRGGGVLGLPGVDGAVDHPGGDLRGPDVPECGQHVEAEPGVVELGGGGRVQAALPPVTDRRDIVGEGNGGVVAGLGGRAHLLEELLDLFGGAYMADATDTLL
ncbi:hypothetical protein K0817_011590 [Microbacterium sp. HD4P20]|uniref:hypothetical protein n=1 Tax=Microbacterium sp. HD4P20 TaxID=2864874 RepID=UPI0020A3B5DA|nr:hypothetical protein [Microbacterium sp. HD4P20]MCP2637201.1 hypothetical protein [Microbacterium sp. HD4P20]